MHQQFPPTHQQCDYNFSTAQDAHCLAQTGVYSSNCDYYNDSVLNNEYTTKNINVGFINVAGLARKSMYPEFVSFMNSHDIICMAETKCDDKLKISGFKLFHKTRKNYDRMSGGICIAIKYNLLPYITEVATGSEYVLWVRVNKDLSHTPQDLIIGSCYIPPENSPYSSQDAFIEIENELIDYFHSESCIMLLGDFNAKTKTMNDLLDMNEQTLDIADDIDVFYDLCTDIQTTMLQCNMNIERTSRDESNCNNHGHRLIDLCKTCNFIILNGRCGADKNIGHVTCKDKTLVDYALLYSNTLDTFTPYFEVSDFSCLLSDVHCSLHVTLKVNEQSSVTPTPHETEQPSPQYQHFSLDDRDRPLPWNNEHTHDFRLGIDINNVYAVDYLLNNLDTADNEDMEHIINQAVNTLSNIISNAAKMASGTKQPRPLNPHPRPPKLPIRENEEWFTLNCKNDRREYNIARKTYNRTKDPLDYTVLQEASRKYKRTLNSSVNAHSVKFSNELKYTRFHKPRDFWNTYHGKKANKVPSTILDRLFEHLKNTCYSNIETNNRNLDSNTTDNTLSDQILNIAITENDVKNAISKLKNGKSPGDDQILNEYIKVSSDILLPVQMY